MDREKEIQRISDLILRSICSTLDEDERRELEAWRRISPRNEAIYRKLAEQQFTLREYERYQQAWRADDWASLLERMRASRRRKRFSWKWAARYAAVLVVAFVAVYWLLGPKEEKPEVQLAYEQEILPGEMKAVLRFEDGEQVA